MKNSAVELMQFYVGRHKSVVRNCHAFCVWGM